jgi:hypothetical protein
MSVLDQIAETCNGIWETSRTGKVMKITTLGPNSKVISALLKEKGESVVNLLKSDGHADDCLNHIHAQVSGRIRSRAMALRVGATITRDSTDFGKTETRDGGRAGNKVIPVHSKLFVRCAHTQTGGVVIDCVLQNYLEKLPLWYIVETKLIASLQQSTMQLAGQIETYKRARVEAFSSSPEGSLCTFMSQQPSARWATLSELLNAFYATSPGANPETLGTLIAMTLRTGILIHVGNTDGGDRFKDKRGVQKLVEEYTTGVELILHA